jgi:hypothetical protein
MHGMARKTDEEYVMSDGGFRRRIFGKIIEGKIMILSPMILPVSVSFAHFVYSVVALR